MLKASRLLTFVTCGTLLALAACVTAGNAGDETPSDSAFVSDHMSFVGYNGHAVLLVLERIKSRSGLHYGEKYMAAIYQESTGWERLPVTLNEIQPSQSGRAPSGNFTEFKVDGEMSTGFSITSQANALALTSKPSAHQYHHQYGASEYQAETAEATLTYGPLKIDGWLIHEHLFTQPNSPWRQFLTGTPFHNFGRVFLRAGHSGMVYLHVEEDGFDGGEAKGATGFTVLQGKLEEVHDVTVRFTDSVAAAGFYSWPRQADVTWSTDSGTAKMRTDTVQKLELANWLIGGAGIDGLVGELKYRGQTLPVFGLCEAIK